MRVSFMQHKLLTGFPAPKKLSRGRRTSEFSGKLLQGCSYTAGSIMSKLHTQGTSLKALQEQLLKEKPYLRKGNGEVMQTVNGS